MRLRVRVPPATQLQIFCVMKTYKTILMLLLAATTACSKDTAEPDTPGPKPSISMTLDYQSREYELGEVIEATLTITEKNPAADYFLLNTSCNGGKAVATVDGHELQWQAEQQIPYEIVNEEFSSKVLHLKITPQAGATAKQPFNFGIYAISADGTKVEKRIYAVSVNTAEIITNAECITPTINLEQQFKFIFDLATEPLGLPIEWYYEWIILAVIGYIAYLIAYEKVGSLYHGDLISGRAAGSFCHWIIRTLYFIVMWAIAYGVIWIGKFVMAHKIQVAIGICSIVAVAIAVKIFIWIKERNKLVKVSVKVENNDNR